MNGALAVAIAVIGPAIALCGVVYTQRRTKRGQEMQVLASAELERVKHRRQEVVGTLNAVIAMVGQVLEVLRHLERVIAEAEGEQFTVPGRAPKETEQIVATRQAAVAALTECADAVGKLSLFGLMVSHDAVVSFLAAVRTHTDATTRPHLDDPEMRAVTEQESIVIGLLRADCRAILGEAGA